MLYLLYVMLYVICYILCLSVCQNCAPYLNRLMDSRGHLASALAESNDTVRWWSLTSRARKIWGSNPQAKHAIDSDLRKKYLWLTRWHIDQRFRVLPNYFGSYFIIRCVQKIIVFHGILWVGMYTCYFHNFGTNSFNLLNYYLSPMLFGDWFYL